MTKSGKRIGGIIAALVFQLPAVGAESCATLEACLARYPVVAEKGSGIGQPEQELAKAVLRYGAQAIPPLLKLLESGKPDVRELAGYTLRDIDGLTAAHLPALMNARRNGDGWIPPAIARIGTPEAVEFLVNDLRNDPETNTQVTWALEMLGAKAAPLLAEFYRCADSCDGRQLYATTHVLGEMKQNAVGVVPRLLLIAGDETVAWEGRRYAVAAIGAIGESAQPFAPQLVALKKHDPTLADAVDSTLTDIGSSEGLSALLRALPVDPEGVLSRISSLGKKGVEAGPTVMRYLDDRRWDIRVAAARTLGSIVYGPAEPALTKALSDEDDWKFVYAAVIALGEMKARESLGALKSVRDSHWYPPVRDITASAVNHIELGFPMPDVISWQFGAVEGSPKSCSAVREKTVAEPRTQKLYIEKHAAELMELSYQAAIRSYGPPEGTKPNKHGVIEVNKDNMVEHIDKVRQVPEVALKVPDGWLVGTDRGEWGGELVHFPAHGARNELYEENIDDIFLLGSQLVATSGLAHMMMNRGLLIRIDKNDTGRYMATPWKRLPAAPETSWLIEGGRLLVNTNGGSVIIDSHGSIRMAECASK